MSSVELVIGELPSMDDASSVGFAPPWSAMAVMGAACATPGIARTVGEHGLEDALQFGGLVAGQFSA